MTFQAEPGSEFSALCFANAFRTSSGLELAPVHGPGWGLDSFQ